MNSRNEGDRLIEAAMEEIPYISCEKYRDLSRGGADYVLIDIREDDDWLRGHMDEAIHVPRYKLEALAEDLLPSKHTPIIIYCEDGRIAPLAAKTLLSMGYTDLRYLQGGYKGLCKNGIAEE